MNELPQTRQSLLIRLGQGTEDGWEEFLTVYEAAIFQYCRRKGLQDADSRDVTQDVLLAVHKRVDTWDADASRGTFRGWLFRTARNIIVDSLNDRCRQPQAGGGSGVAGILAELPQAESEEATLFLMEYRKSLFEWAAAQVRSEVHQNTWKAFCMTAVEGSQPEQVAKELGVSVGSVYAAKCRVVARLRTTISRLDEDVE